MNGRRSIERTTRVLAGGSLFAFIVVWGCSDSTKEKLLAASLAEACSIDSDCRDPYICVFERCHQPCNADRDCKEGEQRCVKGELGVNVCQLDDEIECKTGGLCPPGQVCGVDNECRDPCSDDEECTPTQICANSGECASTLATKDNISGRDIVRDGFGEGAAGTGGAGNTGGGGAGTGEAGDSGGAGAPVQTPGEAGAGGAPSAGSGSGGVGEGGASAAAGAAGSGGVLGDAGQTSVGDAGAAGEDDGAGGAGGASGEMPDYYETSDGVETIDNSDREHTIPLPGTASIYIPGVGDEDWFSVQAPDDGRAHIVEVAIQQEAGLRLRVTALAAEDFSALGSAAVLGLGVSTSLFLSVGPASTTLIGFSPFSGSGRADLNFQLSPEIDEYEPNNARTAARPITVDADVTAQLIVPYVSATNRVADDWYEIELQQGAATLDVFSIPSTGRMTISWVDSRGATLASTTTNPGVAPLLPVNIPEAGTYYLSFREYALTLSSMAVGAQPSYMADPYQFRIEQ